MTDKPASARPACRTLGAGCYVARMARSRAVARGLPVVPVLVAALLGSVGWGWYVGGRATAASPQPSSASSTATPSSSRFADGARREGPPARRRHARDSSIRASRCSASGPRRATYTQGATSSGSSVTLEFDAEHRDNYGRLLAYVSSTGTATTTSCCAAGYARFLVIPPNGAHARAMLAEELDARRARRGLSGACDDSASRSRRGGEDLVDDVERGLRMQEREAGDGLAVPARRGDERDLLCRADGPTSAVVGAVPPARRNSTIDSSGSRTSSRWGARAIRVAVACAVASTLLDRVAVRVGSVHREREPQRESTQR